MIMENEKEIMPVYRNVLIDIYDVNPYKTNKTEDGLDISDEFINSDSGQIAKKDFYIECAKVLETGPKCEFVKSGDDVLILDQLILFLFMDKFTGLLTNKLLKQ